MQERARFTPSRIFSLLANAIAAKPITLVILAVLALYAPNVAFAYFWPVAVPAPVVVLWVVVATLLSAIPATLFQVWAAAVTARESCGAAPGSPLPRLGSMILANLMVMTAVMLGLAVLVVPGIFLALALCVTVPVMTVEGLGIRDALRRSFELTRNRRLKILGAAIVLLLPLKLLGYVAGLAFIGEGGVHAAHASPAVTLGLRPMFMTIMAVASIFYVSAVYCVLRILPPKSAAPEDEYA